MHLFTVQANKSHTMKNCDLTSYNTNSTKGFHITGGVTKGAVYLAEKLEVCSLLTALVSVYSMQYDLLTKHEK